MKKIVLSTCMAVSLFAVDMQVKKGDVVVSINTQEVNFKKGDVSTLDEGTTICYVSGEGKLAIPELKKQLKKAGRCLMVPISEGSATSYMADMKNKATVAFWDSSESVRHGAGTKGQTEFDAEGSFIVKAEEKELLIYGKEFGPLPVLVLLKDESGNELMSVENNESETTIVHIGKKSLKTGMSVEIYNGFEELMLSKKIVVEGM